MATLFMFDDVNVSLIPTTAQFVAYYTDGTYANFTAMKARVPNAHFLGIAVASSYTTSDARALDVEAGDATNAQAVTWTKIKLAAGVKPVLYTSAGNAQALINALAENGVTRSEYFLWSAHYTGTAHICGSDNYPVADATQYTDTASGVSLDESEISTAFEEGVFGVSPVPPVVSGNTMSQTAYATFTDFAWGTSSTATSYDFQLVQGTTQVYRKTFTGTHAESIPTTAGTTYYWRVAPINANGSGDWSAEKTFTTPADPNAFPAPAKLTMSGWYGVTFTWDSVSLNGTDAATYDVQVLDSTGTQFTEKTVSVTSATVSLPKGTYTLNVWANGGKDAPPHATLKFTF
jgi:hypothetical protein